MRGRAEECMLRKPRQVNICVKFNSEDHTVRTNMVLIEIEMVTGYWPDQSSLREAVSSGQMLVVRRYELLENKETIKLYFCWHKN